MSRFRYVKGNIIKITGGKHRVFSKDVIENISAKKVIQTGKEGGVSYGKPEEPPVRENIFLIEGKWTDKDDKEITRIRVGNIVKFHLQTKGIPEGGQVTIQLKDYDGTIYMMFGFLPVKLYDKIDIVTTNKETGVTTPFTHLTVDKEGKAVLTLDLNENMHPMIANDVGAFIELYLTCSYLNEKVDLPTSQDKYLEVGFSERTLYIKPAVKENNYPLPEIFSHKGEIISFILKQKEINIDPKFAIVKVKSKVQFSSMESVDALKKTVYTEGIDFSTGKTDFSTFHVEEVQNLFYSKIDVAEGRMYVDEELMFVPKINKNTYVAYESMNKVIRVGRKVARMIDSYMVLKDIKEMIPALSSNEKFNKPALSSFTFFLPPAISAGFAVLEWVATDMLRDFDEWKEEGIQLEMERLKHSGLFAVRFGLLNNGFLKEKYFLEENIPQPTLEKLLKGKIKNLKQLRNEVFQHIQSESYGGEDSKVFYSLLIRVEPDNTDRAKVNDENHFLESIFIEE